MGTITVGRRRMSYLTAGGGDAPAVLCVHGFVGSKEDFAPVLDVLGRDRQVFAVDLPGHGGSAGSKDPDDYSLAGLAARALDAADALELQRYHLIGHSLGGLVAQRMAAAASGRLCGLVLSDTGVGAPDDDVLDHLADIAVAVRDGGLAAAWQVCARGPHNLGRPAADPVRERFVEARFHELEPAAVIGEARALRSATPLTAFLRGIDLPVLVLHGAGDDIWPDPHQALLARMAAGAERIVVEEAAHSPQIERPDAWAAAVADFLRRADAQTPSVRGGPRR